MRLQNTALNLLLHTAACTPAHMLPVVGRQQSGMDNNRRCRGDFADYFRSSSCFKDMFQAAFSCDTLEGGGGCSVSTIPL